jgi:hypothetical protein
MGTNVRRDTTDPVDNKLKRATEWAEQGYDDRWPARGRANQEAFEWRPLDQINRDGKPAVYRKWPAAR